MRAPLETIALDLAEASRLLIQRILSTLGAAGEYDNDDIVPEAHLYAAAVLIWALQRPGSRVPNADVVEVLVRWLIAFEPRYRAESDSDLFFKAADRRAAQYIVLWEHDADAAPLNAARFFSKAIDRDLSAVQTEALAEVLNTARHASDAFLQATFQRP